MDILDLAAKYLNYLRFQKKYSLHTLRSYLSDLTQILQWKNFGSLELKKQQFGDEYQFLYKGSKKLELSEADLTKYLKAQITKLPNSKNATRQRKVATIKSFLNWLYQEHYIENKLSLLFVLPKTKDKIPNFLSVDEVLSILRYFNSKEAVADSKTPAKKLLFLLLYGGGIRVSEACNLKPQDIKSNTVRVMGKGNKERIVVLPDFVVQQIGKIDKTHPYIWGDKPLHTRTAYDYIHQTGISANLLKSLHPHALRHSFATHMLADGCDLRVLQEALGHSSLQTTQKYLHLDLQKLSETLDKLSPINKVIK